MPEGRIKKACHKSVLFPYCFTVRNNFYDSCVAVPAEWDIECIASLLAQCGEKFCCEVLGNKAINGRTRELAYLLYHIWQVSIVLRNRVTLLNCTTFLLNTTRSLSRTLSKSA